MSTTPPPMAYRNPIQYAPHILKARAIQKLTADMVKLTAKVETIRQDIAAVRAEWAAERAAR